MGVAIQLDTLFLFRSYRRKVMFHSFASPLYRKLLNGIASSAVQRSFSLTTLLYHLLSHVSLYASPLAPAPDIVPSSWTPMGVVTKKNPLMPSPYGPMNTPILSLESQSKSRRRD